MTTIAQLKQKGFVIGPASGAVNCTEVCSPDEFFFFNPLFFDAIGDIDNQVKRARKIAAGTYQLVASGSFSEDENFPFTLLLPEQAEQLREMARAHEAAQDALLRANREVTQSRRDFFHHLASLSA